VSKKLKGYSTKYALTLGIHEVSVTKVEAEAASYGRRGSRAHVLGKDLFWTLPEAKAAAKAAAEKRIKSLERQLAVLRKLAKKPKVVQLP
jgi:hypothetical protein